MATIQATFAAGATLSSAVDLTIYDDTGRQRANEIIFPSGWITGTVSFQVSVDRGATYQALYVGANAYSVPAVAGQAQVLDFGVFGDVYNFKVVSSVAQTAGPTVVVQTIDASKAAAIGGGLGGNSGSGGGGGGTGSMQYTGVATAPTGTATALPSQALVNGVNLYNPVGNQTVYEGSAGITTATGWPLFPGGPPLFLPLNNLNQVYLISGTAGQVINYVAV